MKQRLFFSFAFLVKVAIATLLPLVVFALTGRMIDVAYKTSPWFLAIGVAVALLTTAFWLKAMSKKMIKKMEELD